MKFSNSKIDAVGEIIRKNKGDDDYSKLEKDQSRNHSTVLVAVSDIRNLKKAYPNYFNDLTLFSHVITLILENYRNEGKI